MKYSVKLLIKDLIEEKGISQKKLAEMSNVRESTVSDIVRGNRTVINFDHLAKIAEALEIEDISKLIKIVKIDWYLLLLNSILPYSYIFKSYIFLSPIYFS